MAALVLECRCPIASVASVTADSPALTGAGPGTRSVASDRAPSVRSSIIGLLCHFALGFGAGTSSLVSTAHVVVAVVIAGLTMTGSRNLGRIVQCACYLAAADVLWRSGGALFPWEGAKYAVCGILGIGAMRLIGRFRSIVLPVAYLLMFVPAVALTVVVLGPSGLARGLIAANISGPMALTVGVIFFLQLRITEASFRLAIWTLLGPIVALWGLAVRATLGAGRIDFTDESNFVTAGGFGPNQVSAILGLGALLALLLAVTELHATSRILYFSLGLGLFAQAALTLSRGGVVSAAIAVAAFLTFLRNRRNALRMALVLVAFVALGGFLIAPRLDRFTGGALAVRYADFDTTNRGRLAASDVDVFRRNPVSGVGLGVSSLERGGVGSARVAAHTEYTRLLAEQGTLGAVAIVIMFLLVARAIVLAEVGLPRAFAAAMFAWSLSEMTHSSMRIATIPFVFALGVAASRIRLGFDHGSGPGTASPPAA